MAFICKKIYIPLTDKKFFKDIEDMVESLNDFFYRDVFTIDNIENYINYCHLSLTKYLEWSGEVECHTPESFVWPIGSNIETVYKF